MRSLLFLLVMLLPLSAVAEDETRELLERLRALESLEGTFEQYTLTGDGERMQETRGEMKLQRPRRFHWHSTEPFEQRVVSDGSVVWVHDVDLEQVVKRSLSDEIGNTPALLFSGETDRVTEAFDISELHRNGEEVTWRLTPRKDEELFTLLEVTFRGDTPVSMRLEDALGQKTHVAFAELARNVDIDEACFEFEPPQGADVISEQ